VKFRALRTKNTKRADLVKFMTMRGLGSGDGEGWTLLTRQIAFEPLLSWAASKSQDDHLTKTSLF
jgi:hypothetical protein